MFSRRAPGSGTADQSQDVEPGRARDEERLARLPRVVEALHEAPPPRVLVDLVENHPWLPGRNLAAADARPRAYVVPAQVGGMPQARRTGKLECERGLAHLTRAAEEDHLLGEVRIDGVEEVALRDPEHG